MNIKQATILRATASVLVVAVAVVGGLLVTYKIADFQRNQYFEVRKFQAAAAASCLDWRDVDRLKGDKSDMGSPAFEKLRKQLIGVKHSDVRIRFAYLMRPQGGKMIFLVDAESRDSPDYSPPGQIYYEAKPSDFYPFEGRRPLDPIVEGPIRDRWGVWISATAYILDSSRKPIASIGTDVNVERALASFNQIKTIGTLFTVLASVLLALVSLQWIVWRYNRDRREALRLEMEESILRLNNELLESDRLKSEFIESASHELRGPVTAVDGALQVIERQLTGQLSDAGRELIEIARNGSTRLRNLVDNLLDMTRIEAGGISIKPREVDLAGIAGDTVKLFEPLAGEKGLKLNLEVPEGGIEAVVDPDAMQRILENLISNAIKYTDSGEITVAAGADDEAIRLTVRDTGRGISPKFHDEIFKKFSRLHLSTESRERGAGLGLAICKGLVEAHGGTISFESEEGKGSAFHLEIPRRPPEQQPI